MSLKSTGSEWGIEHVLDSGIKLPPGTETYQIDVLDLHPTQLAVGMQQVCLGFDMSPSSVCKLLLGLSCSSISSVSLHSMGSSCQGVRQQIAVFPMGLTAATAARQHQRQHCS